MTNEFFASENKSKGTDFKPTNDLEKAIHNKQNDLESKRNAKAIEKVKEEAEINEKPPSPVKKRPVKTYKRHKNFV